MRSAPDMGPAMTTRGFTKACAVALPRRVERRGPLSSAAGPGRPESGPPEASSGPRGPDLILLFDYNPKGSLGSLRFQSKPSFQSERGSWIGIRGLRLESREGVLDLAFPGLESGVSGVDLRAPLDPNLPEGLWGGV